MEHMMALQIGTVRRATDHAVERRADNIITLDLPREADRQGVLDWALAAVAEAEQRVVTLQARIEYLAGLSVTDERRKAQSLSQLVGSTPFTAPSGEIRLCVSFGLAFFAGDEREEELMNRADLAMYGQKRRHAAARAARA